MSGAHPEFFLGGTDPETIYNLCLILKIMLQKSCCKYNITPFAAHLYTYKYNYMFRDSITVSYLLVFLVVSEF
jgi:hypothetical protein